MSADPKTVTRIICICLTVLSNCFCFGYLYYKAYLQDKRSKKKIDKNILYFTFFYIIWATITTIYNIAYRFIITRSLCRFSDTFEEYLVAIGRTYLLLFFTYRVETAFKPSSFRFNSLYMNIFRVLIILESLILNTIWIVDMSVTPVGYVGDTFGVYCSNTGRLSYTLTHYIFDFIFNIIVLSMFVDRLIKVTMLAASNERRSVIAGDPNYDPSSMNSKTISDNNNNSEIENSEITSNTPKTPKNEKNVKNEKTGEKRKKVTRVVKQMNTKNDKLIRVGIRQTLLTFLSLLSTWIFGLNAILDINDELGWFYPLDWGINVLCIVCMFRFVKCHCCTDLCIKCIQLCTGVSNNNDNNNAVAGGRSTTIDESTIFNDVRFVPGVWLRALKSKSKSVLSMTDVNSGSNLGSGMENDKSTEKRIDSENDIDDA